MWVDGLGLTRQGVFGLIMLALVCGGNMGAINPVRRWYRRHNLIEHVR